MIMNGFARPGFFAQNSKDTSREGVEKVNNALLTCVILRFCLK